MGLMSTNLVPDHLVPTFHKVVSLKYITLSYHFSFQILRMVAYESVNCVAQDRGREYSLSMTRCVRVQRVMLLPVLVRPGISILAIMVSNGVWVFHL